MTFNQPITAIYSQIAIFHHKSMLGFDPCITSKHYVSREIYIFTETTQSNGKLYVIVSISEWFIIQSIGIYIDRIRIKLQ